MIWFCPKCGHELVERVKESLRVDTCSSCHGVWLDRGELEKLLAAARAEVDEVPASQQRASARDEADHDDAFRPRGHRRRETWFERLADLID